MFFDRTKLGLKNGKKDAILSFLKSVRNTPFHITTRPKIGKKYTILFVIKVVKIGHMEGGGQNFWVPGSGDKTGTLTRF